MGWTRGSFNKADINGPAYGQTTGNSGHVGVATRNAQAGVAPISSATATAAARTSGSPVGVLIAVLVLLVLLRFAAGKSGDADDYGAIAPTFWNVMVITLASILGLTLLKAVSIKWLPANNALRQVVEAA